MSTPIKHMTAAEVEALVVDLGMPRFRAGQILSWIYLKNVDSYDQMTNIPKTMREQLSEAYPLTKASITDKQISTDGSRKYLLQLEDGVYVETVGLPQPDGRLSVCVSSQAGCAMKCAFCATGKSGLTRNLHPGEIIDQILAVQDDFDQRVTNVVVMGQGEPFANYTAVLGALRIMNNGRLLNIGARHITVSTCGLLKGIESFSQEPEQFTLAVSLHSAIQDTRDALMPGVSKQPLDNLREALQSYTQTTGRRFSFEYALMKGVNDSEEELDALAGYCNSLLCHVNLIPLNKVEDSPYKPVSQKTMEHWQRTLESRGTTATIRNSRGADIDGACGQLARNRNQ